MRPRIGVGEIVFLVWIGLTIAAILNLARAERPWRVLQLLWLLVILAFPLVGAALYFVIRVAQRRGRPLRAA